MFWLIVKWILFGLLEIPVASAWLVLAPFAALFVRDGQLPWIFRWLQPQDNDCYGGNDWRQMHPKDYATWWVVTQYLYRNPYGRFGYQVQGVWPELPIEVKGDPLTGNHPGHAGWVWVRCRNSFMLYVIVPWGFGNCIRFLIGWKLFAEQDRDPNRPRTYPAQWALVPAWPFASYT